MGDLDDTARSYFLAKIVNGDTPFRIAGGKFDGLQYFPLSLDGVEYWLTDRGLFDPPTPEGHE